MGTDWASYLEDYHERNAGITEALLDHSTHPDGRGPYDYLAAQIPVATTSILDVASGSAPTAARIPQTVAYHGFDRSRGELAVAAKNYPGRLFVQADAKAVPFATASADTVICSMALMLLDPLVEAICEITRVLRPGGTFVAMYPSIGLPKLREVPTIIALCAALRSAPEFPSHLRKSGITKTFAEAGLQLDSYVSRRYTIPIESDADAARLVTGLYLPSVPPERIASAQAALAKRAGPATSLPMYITHVSARAES